MNGDYVHRWDSPASGTRGNHSSVRTTLDQLLTGLSVTTEASRASCTRCARILREGERILVYAYRMAEHREWNVARYHCRTCRTDEFETPTLCAKEALAEATLGTVYDVCEQTHNHCLLAVDHVATSPPSEGQQR